MRCCGYTLTDFPISIRLTSLALWQSNDCPSASKATLMNMDKYFMWIHYERLHNHNKAKHNKTVCIFLEIYCMHQWTRSGWVQVMACRLFGFNPLSELLSDGLPGTNSMKFEYAFEIVVCQNGGHFSRGRWVNEKYGMPIVHIPWFKIVPASTQLRPLGIIDHSFDTHWSFIRYACFQNANWVIGYLQWQIIQNFTVANWFISVDM